MQSSFMEKCGRWVKLALLAVALLPLSTTAFAQTDQGTITGVVQDSTGAVVPNAQITLTNTDTGLVLNGQADSGGVYVFSPIKIGNYSVSASATGFQTTTQTNVHLDLQQRLNVALTLKPGEVSQTVTVSTAPPLMQTQEASVGQVMSAQTINNVPLNGRNWVYIAQLAAGVDPSQGSRGGGKGDFEANGQRAEQNNFILDGIDNNTNVVDFVNGASYVVQPPPDALAEFKVQTNAYSAEFGHSAGAVINASVKSGTNSIHGDLWEYFRNNVLNARNFNALTVPKYRENQFGATLGFPILKNKLFFFGDVQANRIVSGSTTTQSVPTALMRQGNFTELLNPALTGQAQPVTLYQPNSGGTQLLMCNGQQNVFCPGQINKVAQNILNLYPQPNTNGNLTYNNNVVNLNDTDNTWQWDTRMDYNISNKDQIFGRFSYYHEPGFYPSPLGLPLDGGGFGSDGDIKNLGMNFVGSETHVFTPSLSNEFRFGYSFLHPAFVQPNANVNIAPTLGLGGIPFGPGFPQNGGLPNTSVSGIANFGSTTFYVTNEHQNVYQILDNVTKILGNHSVKVGVAFQSLRFSTLQPPFPRGTYAYNGLYTSNLNASFTGYGVADFLADQDNNAQLSNAFTNGDSHWYNSAFGEDDWRVNEKLTLNLGLRYDHYEPYKDVGGYQASYFVTGPLGVATGSAVYQIPNAQRNFPLAPAFTNLLTKDNITLQYVGNPALVNGQELNFAPRIGVAYSMDPKTVIRSGFGLFYGGIESTGYYPNLGENYPFQFTDTFAQPTCAAGYGNCPSIGQVYGVTLENGFSNALAVGLQNFVSTPALRGSDHLAKTPYTLDFNLAIERALSSNMTASVMYVGNVSRHLVVFPDPNEPGALQNPANSSQTVRPFPDFGGTAFSNYAGKSSYHALQAKIEKRMSNGLNFLATYTWSHSLDDAPTPLGSTGDAGYRFSLTLPIEADYANSAFDTRQRFTFNGYYDLPWGTGRPHQFQSGILNQVAGGWSTNVTFFAQSGNPFTVMANTTAPSGGNTRAIKIGNPNKAGGTPPPSNPTVTCAPKTRNKINWYNPCAFANPVSASEISPGPYNGSYTTPQPGYTYPAYVTNQSDILALLGGVRNNWVGPGYERVNMSIFKSFPIWRETFLQFRTDIFNVFNTPAYGQPGQGNSNNNINTSGGAISQPRFFQNFTPDARFIQFAAKYQF